MKMHWDLNHKRVRCESEEENKYRAVSPTLRRKVCLGLMDMIFYQTFLENNIHAYIYKERWGLVSK